VCVRARARAFAGSWRCGVRVHYRTLLRTHLRRLRASCCWRVSAPSFMTGSDLYIYVYVYIYIYIYWRIAGPALHDRCPAVHYKGRSGRLLQGAEAVWTPLACTSASGRLAVWTPLVCTSASGRLAVWTPLACTSASGRLAVWTPLACTSASGRLAVWTPLVCTSASGRLAVWTPLACTSASGRLAVWTPLACTSASGRHAVRVCVCPVKLNEDWKRRTDRAREWKLGSFERHFKLCQ
jgi:hypothetical protein